MNDDENSFKIWIYSALIVVGVGVIWGGIAYCVDGLDSAAKFGDSFGPINSVFSSLAAAGAVYAVILQRKELRESRKAAEDSAKAQADLVKLQANTAVISELKMNRNRLQVELKDLHTEYKILTNIAGFRERLRINSEISVKDRELKSCQGEIDKVLERIEGFLAISAE